jgi:thiamine kinase-like enzyme
VVLPGDISQFKSVVASVAELARSSDLSVRVLSGGLTNTSYLVDTDEGQFVVRIGCDNGPALGIDRVREEAAFRRAERAGIAPEILLFTQPEGHLVTRYLAGAHNLSIEEFTTPATVARLAARLRDVHSLAPVDGRFNPYDDIRRWMALVEARGTTQPTRLASLLVRVDETERVRTPASESELVLCHNDPYHLNFLDDGTLWLIDWEYAGMGEGMYDLAGIAYMLDGDGRELLLGSYFGSVEPEMRQDLDSLIPVFVCWNVVWSLVEMEGGVVGFDYLTMAEEFLDRLPDLDCG